MARSVTLQIDRIRLRLPPGFGNRANAIVRELGLQLAAFPWTSSAKLERLSVPALSLIQGDSNAGIAAKLARNLWLQLGTDHPQGTPRPPGVFRAGGIPEIRRAAPTPSHGHPPGVPGVDQGGKPEDQPSGKPRRNLE